MSFRPCSFPADVDSLAVIHSSYARGLSGVHARSAERWRTWVPYLVGATMWVAEQSTSAGAATIVAYVATRHRRGVTTLAEYGASDSWRSSGSEATAFLELVAHSLSSCARLRSDSGSSLGDALRSSGSDVVRVVCPLVVARRVFGDDAYGPVKEVEDGGWMYKDVPAVDGGGATPSLALFLREHPDSHLVWNSDYF